MWNSQKSFVFTFWFDYNKNIVNFQKRGFFTMDEIEPKKKYITWQVLALMDFVTVIGFDDIIYNFQNQGMAVVFSWIVLLFAYVLPYELMVGHLGRWRSFQLDAPYKRWCLGLLNRLVLLGSEFAILGRCC